MSVSLLIANFNTSFNKETSLGAFLQQKAKLILKAVGEELGTERAALDVVLKLLVEEPLDLDCFLQTMQNDLHLQMVYNKTDGNVCFMEQNDELRDDFKFVYEPLDVLNYLYAVSSSTKYSSLNFNQLSDGDVPKTTTQFWNLVRFGEKIRETYYTSFLKDSVSLQETLVRLTQQVDDVLLVG